ncbi:Os05g0210550 [Oryza sativa Japonica Group]|uniref:Os05g0210550 protein n=1 Tax=Oryza sativa subsp. japonica TaxID=39947 RepID=A0A0P0WJ80_ORYSJ|nr:Os05g0210550 [Oryza sativa Japonica Group]
MPEKSSDWHRSSISISFLHTPSSMRKLSSGLAFLLLDNDEIAFLPLPPPPPRKGTMARDEKDTAIPTRGRRCYRRAARPGTRRPRPS